MIGLDGHSEGVILPVAARPGAKKNEVRGEQNGALKVFVTQVPEKGKANKVLIEVLAKALRLKKSQIELVSGETSHQKKFLVRNITRDELAEKIAPLL